MWVFCCGMMRSGSTLQYQITKTLVEGAGAGIGVGSCVPGRFRELLEEHGDTRGLRVVKTHRYLPTARAMLRSGRARAIYIHRDLRDVVVSRMFKEQETFRQVMAAGFVEQLLEDDAIWSEMPNTLLSVYERVLGDVRTEVVRIAEFLGLEIDAATIDRVAAKHTLANQKRRIQRFDYGRSGIGEGRTNVVDPDTLLHHNHIRSGAAGQWAEELTPAQVREVERVAGEWLVRRGYGLSDPDGGSAGRLGRIRGRARRARLRTDARFRLQPYATALKIALLAPVRAVLRGLTSVGFATAVGEPIYRLTGRRSAGRTPELAAARRVLVVRPDEIGDVVLTSPLLRELRRAVPSAEITLVVKPSVRNLVEHCPHVDRVVAYDWSVSGLGGRLRRHLRALRLARRELWPRRFDLALLPRWDRDRYNAGFVTYISGATRRVGYSEAVTEARRRRDAGHDRFLTIALPASGPRHEVERGLDVLRAIGGTVESDSLELWLHPSDADAADELLGANGVGASDAVVALGIGATHRRRVWPVPRVAEIARWLHESRGMRVVLLGGAEDRALGESVVRQAGPEVVDLTGRTTLRQAGALLRRASMYVGNDTGVMHLAAAAGTAVVEISCHPRTGSVGHANSPVRFGPWRVPHRVLAPAEPLSPCVDGCDAPVAHCITRVPVDEVRNAVVTLLRASHARSGADTSRSDAVELYP